VDGLGLEQHLDVVLGYQLLADFVRESVAVVAAVGQDFEERQVEAHFARHLTNFFVDALEGTAESVGPGFLQVIDEIVAE
jgi:hypothetical protein